MLQIERDDQQAFLMPQLEVESYGVQFPESSQKRYAIFGARGVEHNNQNDEFYLKNYWSAEQVRSLFTALDEGDAPKSIALLSKVSIFDAFFKIPCYVKEGFGTGEHAQSAMNLAVELFPELPIEPSKFRLAMLLHDIGKGYSRICGPDYDTGKYYDQHFMTQSFAEHALRLSGILSKKEARGLSVFISQDIIGEWIFGKGHEPSGGFVSSIIKIPSLEDTLEQIKSLSELIELPIDVTYTLMKAYFICDSGSYTTRGWYISDETGERTRSIQLYDCVYEFNQPATGPLKMVPAAAGRLRLLDEAMAELCAQSERREQVAVSIGELVKAAQ